MRCPVRAHWFACLCVLLCAPTNALSQVASDRASDTATPATSVREAQPPIIYTLEDGKPVAWVKSYPLEEIDRLRQLEKQAVPTFVITVLELNAIASTDRATIRGMMGIRLLQSGPHIIPMRMKEMFFAGNPRANGKPVYVQPGDDGYELILEGKTDDEFKVEFDAVLPLHSLGDETRFGLTVPRVGLSQLTIELPDTELFVTAENGVFITRLDDIKDAGSGASSSGVSKSDADVNAKPVSGDSVGSDNQDGSGEPVDSDDSQNTDGSETGTAPQTSDEDATVTGNSGVRYRINSLVPDIDVRWRKTPEKEKLQFEVKGTVEIEIDALGRITGDAMLTMTSYNEPIERITVKLPPETRWSGEEIGFGGYVITPMNMDGNRRQLQIVFDEPAVKPPVIPLRVKSEKELSRFEPGFTVVGANSEFGTVSVFSDETRLLNWNKGEFIRRIANLDSGRPAIATFEYSRPEELALTISKQETLVDVEPSYHLELDENKATLTAIFQCKKRGGNPERLSFELGDWTFQNLGPDPNNVIADFAVASGPGERLEIPLRDTSEEFEVSFIATRPFPESLVASGDDDRSRLEFRFPHPIDVDTLLHSTVVVSTADNVVARQDPGQDEGQAARQDADVYTEVSLPDRLREELEVGANPPCFASRKIGVPEPFQLLATTVERRTDVECDIEVVDIDATRIRLRQRMKWKVSGVPLQHALLWMKRSLYRESGLQVSVNGESKIDQISEVQSFPDFATGNTTIRIPLPPDVGSFDMTVTWDWDNRDPQGDATDLQRIEELDIDLVQPKRASGTLAQNMSVNARFRKPLIPGYDVTLSGIRNQDLRIPWAADVPGQDPDVEATTDPQNSALPMILPLSIEQIFADEEPTDFEELVDRAWFQTWYTNSTRTDRAVFRVISGGALLRVRMPDITDFRKLNTFVDGKLTEFRREGASTIELDVDPTADLHVVELQYSLNTREPPGKLETVVPRIEGADILGQWYWHIVMPRNECMITWPRNLTRAHTWDWSVLIPRRRPELSLKELEDWNGATRTGGMVLAGSGEYLFGAMGEADTLTVRTMLLPTYVLLVAGSILVFGLMLIYSRRRILVVMAMGAGISCLIFLHPSYASIAGQVAVFGVILAVAAGLMAWLVRRVTRTPAPVPALTRSTRDVRRELVGSSVDGTTTLAAGSSRLPAGRP